MNDPLILSVSFNQIAIERMSSFLTVSGLVLVVGFVPSDEGIFVICRSWVLCSAIWRSKGSKGNPPHPRRVVLSWDTSLITFRNFLKAADVVHQTSFRKIPASLQENVHFFSHCQNERGILKATASQKLSLIPNIATKKRMVGTLLLAEITKKLRKMNPCSGSFRINFPFPKAEVTQILSISFPLTRRGASQKGVLLNPLALDDLCGEKWDALTWSSGFYTFISSLRVSVCSTETFTFPFKVATERSFSAETYRELSAACFERNNRLL